MRHVMTPNDFNLLPGPRLQSQWDFTTITCKEMELARLPGPERGVLLDTTLWTLTIGARQRCIES